MVKLKQIVFALILIGTNIKAAGPEDTLAILSRLLNKRSQSNPVILLITDKKTNFNNGLRTSDNHVLTGSGKWKIPDDTVDEKKTNKFVKDILRSTGDDNDPKVIETKLKFAKALRARCEVYLDCTVKCAAKKKPKKDKCQKNCQEVYDYLKLCHPPGGKKKKKKKKKDSCEESDSCEPTEKPKGCTCQSADECADIEIHCKPAGKGKTMPPTWRM